MISIVTKEELVELSRRWGTVTDVQRLISTLKQSQDALKVALEYIDGKGKDRPDKALTRAILRETLGLPNE